MAESSKLIAVLRPVFRESARHSGHSTRFGELERLTSVLNGSTGGEWFNTGLAAAERLAAVA